LYKLLGGFRDKVPAYADGGMYMRTPDELAERMVSYVQQGFRDVKFHLMGETLEQTLLAIEKTREAIGHEVRLMVDVHRQWNLVDDYKSGFESIFHRHFHTVA
jgi:L-alanine-DL-glutamate epimerase-like enolase superfamily enzyme